MNGVNSKVLTWARNRKQLSQAEVAKKLKVSNEIVNEWEQGTSVPGYQVLEKLAYEIYQIPLAGFFVQKIPKDVDPEAKFRRLLSGIGNPSQIFKQIHQASCFQAYLPEIFSTSTWAKVTKTKINSTNSAEAILSILGLESGYIKKINKPEDHFELLREKLFDTGVAVYKASFKNDDISGFCLPDSEYPVIMINNSCTPTRQVFTIVHEFAHILKDSFGITKWDFSIGSESSITERNEEEFCNKVAAEFLLPKKILDEYVSNGNVRTESFYEMISKDLKISREVVLRICLDLGLIQGNFYNSYRNKWNSQIIGDKGGGGNYYFTKRAYLGKQYAKEVVNGFYLKKWDKITASEYLDIKPVFFDKFEAIIRRP